MKNEFDWTWKVLIVAMLLVDLFGVVFLSVYLVLAVGGWL